MLSDSRTPHHGNIPLITAVLGVGFTAGLIPAGLLPANVLNIERAYSLSHSEVGRIVGLCMVFGGASGGLLSGFLCSRIGAIRVILAALALAAGSLGSVGTINSLYATIGGLAGYFFSAGLLGSSNVLATQMLADRQRGLSLLHAMNGVGKLTGPAIASIFLYGAWRNGFIAAAMVPLMLVVPAFLAYRNGGVNTIGRKESGGGHAGLYFWIALAGFGLIGGSEIAVSLWTPAYAQKVRGLSAVQGNMLLAVCTVGFVAGRFLCSAFSKRLTPRQMIGICGYLLVSIIPALSVSSYPLMLVFFGLLGMAFSTMWPSYFAHLSQVFPEHLGLMGGTAVFATQTGFALCSLITGRLAEFNLAYAIFFGACTMGLFTLLFFVTPVGRSGEPA